jgi:hypothetical protein
LLVNVFTAAHDGRNNLGSGSATAGANFQFTLGQVAPTPTPTVTPAVFTWTNPAGGAYASAANWSPPEEPGSVVGRDDLALFDLVGGYAVTVDSARAARFLVRHATVDLSGGTVHLTGSSLALPSCSVGSSGRLDLTTSVPPASSPCRVPPPRSDRPWPPDISISPATSSSGMVASSIVTPGRST